jgi:hypothetical protein
MAACALEAVLMRAATVVREAGVPGAGRRPASRCEIKASARVVENQEDAIAVTVRGLLAAPLTKAKEAERPWSQPAGRSEIMASARVVEQQEAAIAVPVRGLLAAALTKAKAKAKEAAGAETALAAA